MEPSDVDDAAMFLLHLRLHRGRVGNLPYELAPKTIDEAYDIQDAVHRFAGWPIGMLKVGCTSLAAQQALGISHPAGGRVPADAVFPSGSIVPRSFLGAAPQLECEIALRVGADGGFDAVAPAIELIDPRFHDIARVSGPNLIADNSAASGVVLGAALPVDSVALDSVTMRLVADGSEIATGSVDALVDGPIGSLEWALAHEAARGRVPVPGTWVITGTCTGLTPAEWGTTYSADFGDLGTVEFTLDD